MAGEDDHPPAGGNRPAYVLNAMRLDPAAWLEDPDRPEVRVFGCDAPEIVPHRGDDAADLAGGKLGQGPFQIAPGLAGYAEKRADQAADRAA